MEEVKPQTGAQADEKQQLRIDDSTAETTYTNFFMISTGIEEFLVNFGMRSTDPTTVKLSDKIVMSPKNFKRLAIAASQSLKMFEDRFGVIDVSPPKMQEPPSK